MKNLLYLSIALGGASLALTIYLLIRQNKLIKETVKFMGEQTQKEQELTDALNDIKGSLGTVKTGVGELKTKLDTVTSELERIKAENPDLSDELVLATETATEARELAASFAEALPDVPEDETPQEPETPVEDEGGETVEDED